MRRLFLILVLALCSSAFAQTPPGPLPICPAPKFTIPSGSNITVTWTAPTTFLNGSAISGSITYNLYSIAATAQLLASGLTATSSIRSNLNAGTPCYAVTAVVNGVESPFSSAASAQVVNVPNPPTGLTCTLNIPAGGGAVSGSCTTQ